MTRLEHLLTTVAEEAVEVAQRATKALRFGLEQVQEDADDRPEQNPERLTNRQRLMDEFFQLRAVLGMAGMDAWDNSGRAKTVEARKVANVERYLERSRRCGTLATPEFIDCITANRQHDFSLPAADDRGQQCSVCMMFEQEARL